MLTRTTAAELARTQPGTGSQNSSSPPLMLTSRKPPYRLNQAWVVFTSAGPPPSITGIRYDRAPVSS